ncbi:MAG: cellulase family glycosylhydrolase [Solirubrobacterales bacterium]
MRSLTPRIPLLASLVVLVALAAAMVTAPRAHAAGQEMGVQAHLLWGSVDADDVRTQLDHARDAGVTMVRVDLGWGSLEPSEKGRFSSYELGRIDRVVDEAEARGIKVMFTVWQSPCWASSAPESKKQGCEGSWWNRGVQLYPPKDPADFADAAARLAERYGSRVAAWELWNEPNASSYFKSSDPAGEYADLVKAAYPAIKAAEPGAHVVAGSLMHSDVAFTEDLYRHGIAGKFDAFSIHPYSEDRSPTDPGDDRWIRGSFVRGVPAVRDVMVRHGDRQPMWLTEFGWSTCSERDGDNWENCVSEQRQATWLTDAYEIMRSWSYVRGGFWFKLMSGSDDSLMDQYGLVRRDGSRKPAHSAMRAASASAPASVPAPKALPAPQPPPHAPDDGAALDLDSSVDIQVSKAEGVVRLAGRADEPSVLRIEARERGGKRRRIAATTRVAAGRFSRKIRRQALKQGSWELSANVVRIQATGSGRTSSRRARLSPRVLASRGRLEVSGYSRNRRTLEILLTSVDGSAPAIRRRTKVRGRFTKAFTNAELRQGQWKVQTRLVGTSARRTVSTPETRSRVDIDATRGTVRIRGFAAQRGVVRLTALGKGGRRVAVNVKVGKGSFSRRVRRGALKRGSWKVAGQLEQVAAQASASYRR